MKSGQIDSAIVQSDLPVKFEGFLWSVELWSESYYAILPIEHRLSKRDCVTLAHLRREAIVTYPPECDTRQSIVPQILHPSQQLARSSNSGLIA